MNTQKGIEKTICLTTFLRRSIVEMGSGTLANFLLDERVASIVAVILTATLSYVFTKRSENKNIMWKFICNN